MPGAAGVADRGRTMGYRFLEHTADLAVEVNAASLAELFSEALRAMTDCVTDVERVERRLSRGFELTGEDPELLLVDWLSELLCAFEIEGQLFSTAATRIGRRDGKLELTAEAGGEIYDPQRHPLKVLIKGVTYHGLEVREQDGVWRATIVFDI